MSVLRQWLLACLLAWAAMSAAHAHLVVSQNGTLNIVGSGAYMVLSLPVSAFSGIDDNHDGKLSIDELRTHAASIESQIKQGVTLGNDQALSKPEGVMLNLAPSASEPAAPTTHLIVLGRFAIPEKAANLKLTLLLFGTRSDEQTEQIAVTRGQQSQLITLTPEHPQGAVLPSVWFSFVEQIRLGAHHVLSGADHLLFLLVVLATALNLRQALLLLTCFTAGHAMTLVACVWYGLSVPASIVEPAIAATIVFMVVFDRWSAHRSLPHLVATQMTLVFVCALIHGLGLAQSYRDLGINGIGKATSLAGFNVGIELGQIAVALSAALAVRGVRQLGGSVGLAKITRVFSNVSITLGGVWFLLRTLG